MKLLVKLVIGIALAAGFFYMFLRTAHDVRSEPYTVSAAHLQTWTWATESGARGTSPVLVLRPPQDLGGGLFGQIFQRMMESMKGSTGAGVPIVLRDEYEFALAGRYTPEALLDAARAAGLDQGPFTPVCVATRRVSQPGLTRQLYFVLFDAPAIVAFRQRIAEGLEAMPGVFEPAALSPVLLIGASDADFDTWLPLRATSDDCVAPVTVN
jgi:hypothetical protein